MSNDELELKGATSEATAIKPRGPSWRGFAGHLSAALLLFPRNVKGKGPLGSGETLSVNSVAQPSSTFSLAQTGLAIFVLFENCSF